MRARIIGFIFLSGFMVGQRSVYAATGMSCFGSHVKEERSEIFVDRYYQVDSEESYADIDSGRENPLTVKVMKPGNRPYGYISETEVKAKVTSVPIPYPFGPYQIFASLDRRASDGALTEVNVKIDPSVSYLEVGIPFKAELTIRTVCSGLGLPQNTSEEKAAVICFFKPATM